MDAREVDAQELHNARMKKSRRLDTLEQAIHQALSILRSGAEHHRLASYWKDGEVVGYGGRVANHADFAVACLERALGLEGK